MLGECSMLYKALLVTYNLHPNISSCNFEALPRSRRLLVKLGRISLLILARIENSIFFILLKYSKTRFVK